MSLAIATKLKQGVTYGDDYTAISLTVHANAIDGYDMLYNLISYAHPRLMQNKSRRSTKPVFNGDIHQFTTSYRSWLLFQENKDRPHYYEHDERADDFVLAIKSSSYLP